MLLKAPLSLSESDKIPFGRYEGLIDNTDTNHWQQGFFDRRWKRKGWIYCGIYNAEIALGFAIADTGYLGKAFIYLYHFSTKTFIEEAAQMPFYFNSNFMPSLKNNWLFKANNKKWQIDCQNEKLQVSFSGKKIKTNFELHDFDNGMSTIAQAGLRPFNFTFKNAAILCKGKVKFNNETIDINGHDAVLDFTLGFPPRETKWNWASLTGKTDAGKTVGINLVAHFNQGLENVLFLDGKIIPLSEAQFHYTYPAEHNNWQIATKDGILNFTFKPYGARKENINALLLKHQFIQPFGTFEGFIKLQGEVLNFKGYGVTEEHHSLW